MNNEEYLINLLESAISMCKSNDFILEDYIYTTKNTMDEPVNMLIMDTNMSIKDTKPRLVGKTLELTINWRVR